MALRQQKSLKRLKRKPTTSSRSLKKASPSPRSTVKAKSVPSQRSTSTKSVPKKRMSVRSAKAKGRKLQNWVAEQLLDILKKVTSLDVRSTPMGVNGVDVQMSTAAYVQFPYDIECKNTERMTTLYNYYEQAISHDSGGEPLLIVKMNHKKPLAVVDAEHFIKVAVCQKKTQ